MDKSELFEKIIKQNHELTEEYAQQAQLGAKISQLRLSHTVATHLAERLLAYYGGLEYDQSYVRSTGLIPLGEVDADNPHGLTHGFLRLSTKSEAAIGHREVKTILGRSKVKPARVPGEVETVNIDVYSGNARATEVVDTGYPRLQSSIKFQNLNIGEDYLAELKTSSDDLVDVLHFLASDAGLGPTLLK